MNETYMRLFSQLKRNLRWFISQKKKAEQFAEREFYLEEEEGMYHDFMETAKMYHKLICRFKRKIEHAKKFYICLSELKSRYPVIL